MAVHTNFHEEEKVNESTALQNHAPTNENKLTRHNHLVVAPSKSCVKRVDDEFESTVTS